MIMDIHKSSMDIHNSSKDIQKSFMDIQNSFMDIQIIYGYPKFILAVARQGHSDCNSYF